MIRVECVQTWGFEHAIRGMRNPMNSWEKSDSGCFSFENEPPKEYFRQYGLTGFYSIIGANDLALMQKLYKGGGEHRKYLRQIFVSMDIVAPLYWWKEFDTYKVGTVANSCSTMHKIHAKEFELDDFSHEHLLDSGEKILACLIIFLNNQRYHFLNTGVKGWWWQMIQLLPSSYNQRRTVTMNYENVVNMIHQREHHKLDEWKEFVNQLKQLPYVMQIMGGDNHESEKIPETDSENL